MQPAPVTVAGLPPGAEALALRKGDGTVLVAVWPNANRFTGGARVVVPVTPVRLALQGERRNLDVYDPTQGMRPILAAR